MTSMINVIIITLIRTSSILMRMRIILVIVLLTLVASQENDKFFEENWFVVSVNLGLIDKLTLSCLFINEATLYRILSFQYFMKLEVLKFR